MNGAPPARRPPARESGLGASVLVATISSAFGVLILSGVGYLSAAISAVPEVDSRSSVQNMLSVLGGVILAVAVYVAAVVTANTFATIVSGRTRQIALMRLIGSTARAERRRVAASGLAVGAIGAVLGLAGGVGASFVLVAILDGRIDVDVSYAVLQPSLVLPAGIVVLTTWAAAWVGSRRVLAVTPLQALAATVERTGADVRHPTRTAISTVAIGVGVLGLAGGVLLGLRSPMGLVVAFFGGALSFAGIAAGAVVLVPPVLALTGRLFGTRVTARMAAQNALRYPERSSRMAIGVVIAVTLVTMMAVASESAKAVLTSASGGELDPAVESAMNVTAAVLMALLAVSAVIAGVSLVNLLYIGVLQRRRELGLLRALGLSRPQANTMVLLEATHVAFTAVALGLLLGIGYGWAAAQATLGSLEGANAAAGYTLVAPAVPWPVVGLIVAATVVLTLGAAAVPARLASRVTPVEALARL